MASVDDIKQARGIIGGLLQRLLALPVDATRILQKRIEAGERDILGPGQGLPSTQAFFSWSIIRADQAGGVVPDVEPNRAQVIAAFSSITAPTPYLRSNVIFWPIGDWAMRDGSWRLLAAFVGRPKEVLSLERGSLTKVIDFTKRMLDAVDAKLVGQVPPEEIAITIPIYKKWWFWAAVGVVVVGGGYALTRKSRSSPDRARINESATA